MDRVKRPVPSLHCMYRLWTVTHRRRLLAEMLLKTRRTRCDRMSDVGARFYTYETQQCGYTSEAAGAGCQRGDRSLCPRSTQPNRRCALQGWFPVANPQVSFVNYHASPPATLHDLCEPVARHVHHASREDQCQAHLRHPPQCNAGSKGRRRGRLHHEMFGCLRPIMRNLNEATLYKTTQKPEVALWKEQRLRRRGSSNTPFEGVARAGGMKSRN